MNEWIQTRTSSSHPVYEAIRRAIDWDADVAIAPTQPHYNGPRRWVVFVEDWVTLYEPFLMNGSTGSVDVLGHPHTSVLRERFASPNFLGIICHHRGTFQDLVYLNLTDKLHYMPYGVPPQEQNDIGQKDLLHFTFINSWKAGDTNFRNRGGELMLRAFEQLWADGERSMRLTIACEIPPGVEGRQFARQCPNITVIEHYITDNQLHSLMQQTDCLLLPSHRVHVNSLLMPMSYGVPIISSDGWGNEEYVVDGVSGYRVRPVFGHVTWHDQVMREDYSRWRETLPAAESVARYMKKLTRDRAMLRRMGTEAWLYARSLHHTDRMRESLARILPPTNRTSHCQ